jgi:hypothetical protein
MRSAAASPTPFGRPSESPVEPAAEEPAHDALLAESRSPMRGRPRTRPEADPATPKRPRGRPKPAAPEAEDLAAVDPAWLPVAPSPAPPHTSPASAPSAGLPSARLPDLALLYGAPPPSAAAAAGGSDDAALRFLVVALLRFRSDRTWKTEMERIAPFGDLSAAVEGLDIVLTDGRRWAKVAVHPLCQSWLLSMAPRSGAVVTVHQWSRAAEGHRAATMVAAADSAAVPVLMRISLASDGESAPLDLAALEPLLAEAVPPDNEDAAPSPDAVAASAPPKSSRWLYGAPLLSMRESYVHAYSDMVPAGRVWFDDRNVDLDEATALEIAPETLSVSGLLALARLHSAPRYPPPLVARIASVSNILHFGSDDVDMKHPYRAELVLTDGLVGIPLTLWGSSCRYYYQFLSVGLLVVLRHYRLSAVRNRGKLNSYDFELALNPRPNPTSPGGVLQVLRDERLSPLPRPVPPIRPRLLDLPSTSQLDILMQLTPRMKFDVIVRIVFVGRIEVTRSRLDMIGSQGLRDQPRWTASRYLKVCELKLDPGPGDSNGAGGDNELNVMTMLLHFFWTRDDFFHSVATSSTVLFTDVMLNVAQDSSHSAPFLMLCTTETSSVMRLDNSIEDPVRGVVLAGLGPYDRAMRCAADLDIEHQSLNNFASVLLRSSCLEALPQSQDRVKQFAMEARFPLNRVFEVRSGWFHGFLSSVVLSAAESNALKAGIDGGINLLDLRRHMVSTGMHRRFGLSNEWGVLDEQSFVGNLRLEIEGVRDSSSRRVYYVFPLPHYVDPMSVLHFTVETGPRFVLPFFVDSLYFSGVFVESDVAEFYDTPPPQRLSFVEALLRDRLLRFVIESYNADPHTYSYISHIFIE